MDKCDLTQCEQDSYIDDEGNGGYQYCLEHEDMHCLAMAWLELVRESWATMPLDDDWTAECRDMALEGMDEGICIFE